MWGCMRHVTVEPVLFLFMMAMFIQIPITQMLILRKVCLTELKQNICDNLHLKENAKFENDVQTKTSHWILYLQLFAAIPGAVMSLIFGASSDKIGRKIIMVIPVMGGVINAVLLIISAYFIELPLEFLIPGAVAVGLTGNFGTFYIALVSYIADITTEESRTKRLGILESMVFIGGTIGLLMTGLILNIFGFTPVYILVVGLHICILLYVGFILAESLPASKRQPLNSKDKELGCLSSLKDSLHNALVVYFKHRPGNNRKYLLLLQCMTIIGVLCMSGEMDLTVLFTKHQPLSWSATLLGMYLGLKNICRGLVLIGGLPLYYHLLGRREPQQDIILGQIGLISSMLAFIVVAFAQSTVVMMLVPVVGSLAGFTGAVMGALKTQLVASSEFGAMFACSSFLDTLIALLGSILFNSLYPATLEFWPGFSFVLMAGLSLTSLAILTYMKYNMKIQPIVSSLHTNTEQVANLLSDHESDEDEINDSNLKMEPMYDWGKPKPRTRPSHQEDSPDPLTYI